MTLNEERRDRGTQKKCHQRANILEESGRERERERLLFLGIL